MKATTLAPGPHPGFGKLTSKPGVFRARLRPVSSKTKPEHADYCGVLQLAGGKKAFVLLWVHGDGSLGLRLDTNSADKKGAAF
jgi:hypothetical protein